MNTTPPALPADLEGGLRRLKLASMRRLAPELLVTAKTQRWTPEEFLRTLVEAEITARDASNTHTRRRLAGFPVTKTLDTFDVSVSSIPAATINYLASLEWIRATENVCLIGPPGTGKSHMLLALGEAAVEAGHRVKYFTAADLVRFGTLSADMAQVLDVIGKGAAQSWQMDNRARTMAADEFEFGFAVEWMRKDLGIVLDEADRNGARLPMTALVDQFYKEVVAQGGDRWDTSSLIRLLN